MADDLRIMSACLALALAVALVAATTAHGAGSLRLSASSDPVRGLPITFTLAGTPPGADAFGNSSYVLWRRIRPAGVGPCAPTVDADPQSELSLAGGPELPSVSAPFSFSWSLTVPDESSAGSYLFCAWLVDLQGSGETVAVAALPISVRPPRYRLALIAPNHPRVGQRRAFTARGSAEGAAHLEAWLLPAHLILSCVRTHAGAVHCRYKPLRGCEASPDAEQKLLDEGGAIEAPHTVIASANLAAGRSFSFTRRLLGESPGTYVLCGWIEEGARGGSVQLLTRASVTVRR